MSSPEILTGSGQYKDLRMPCQINYQYNPLSRKKGMSVSESKFPLEAYIFIYCINILFYYLFSI